MWNLGRNAKARTIAHAQGSVLALLVLGCASVQKNSGGNMPPQQEVWLVRPDYEALDALLTMEGELASPSLVVQIRRLVRESGVAHLEHGGAITWSGPLGGFRFRGTIAELVRFLEVLSELGVRFDVRPWSSVSD